MTAPHELDLADVLAPPGHRALWPREPAFGEI